MTTQQTPAVHLIVDRVPDKNVLRVYRASACGSYVGGSTAFRKHATCPECLARTRPNKWEV